MGIYNMMDDFRFLYPKKSETHKNIRPDRQHLNGLSNTYCLFWNDDERKRAVNIIQEINYFYDGLIDGEVIFSGECSSEYKDDLLVATRQCVYKKIAMFSRLRNYHHEVLRKYPKAGHLCFSLDVEKNIGSFEGYAAHDEIMKSMTKKLFNNLKSLALFSHVAAFFGSCSDVVMAIPTCILTFTSKSRPSITPSEHQLIKPGSILLKNKNGKGVYVTF